MYHNIQIKDPFIFIWKEGVMSSGLMDISVQKLQIAVVTVACGLPLFWRVPMIICWTMVRSILHKGDISILKLFPSELT